MNKTISLLLLLTLAGCTGVTGNAVAVGDSISVEYTGTLSDGTVFDSNVGGESLTFTAGGGQMIPGFDQEMIGMTVGEEKTFTLNSAQGYGERHDELIIEYNKSEMALMIGQEPELGMVLYSEAGPITVMDVGEENVTLDLNHPLAGKDLTFTVKLLSIN